MSGPAIVARGVGKWFGRRTAERPGTLQETLLRGLRGDRERGGFWALRDVTFAIEANRAVGMVGNNGAGKSTLLRLLGGVGRPDEGELAVSGRVGALLDLSAGFHGDLSGRENVYVAGVVAGLTQKEVRQRFDEIVDFADLHDFIDNPYRTYSAGMQMRLGFAVAIHADPETLLMDELLSVGDHAFQRRCLQRIIRLRERGTTVMLASHDSILVRRVCDDAIWLQDGKVAAFGEAAETVGH
jgi:lipopolysaccharide transport system ATP-binding protein